jgi:phosphoribosylanthranilate isomerase
MTKIKLCGLTRPIDIQMANLYYPDYIGFVFAPKSRRCILPEQAARLKKNLHPKVLAVGVFVNEDVKHVANLLESGVIDLAQLHGSEDEAYIRQLRKISEKKIIKAFQIISARDVEAATQSTADYVLFDSGAGGTGTTFDRKLVQNVKRPYFLAGGLSPTNVREAVENLRPFAVDVSSNIETDGFKDEKKIKAFIRAVRNTNGKEAQT